MPGPQRPEELVVGRALGEPRGVGLGVHRGEQHALLVGREAGGDIREPQEDAVADEDLHSEVGTVSVDLEVHFDAHGVHSAVESLNRFRRVARDPLFLQPIE